MKMFIFPDHEEILDLLKLIRYLWLNMLLYYFKFLRSIHIIYQIVPLCLITLSFITVERLERTNEFFENPDTVNISPNESCLAKFVGRAFQIEEKRIRAHLNGASLRKFLEEQEEESRHNSFAIEFDDNLSVSIL